MSARLIVILSSEYRRDFIRGNITYYIIIVKRIRCYKAVEDDIIIVFLKEKEISKSIADNLTAYFGQPDAISPWLSFHHTEYYRREMGGPLVRRLFAFGNLILQDRLPGIKLLTNRIEKDFMVDGKRRVNIDPGYLLAERFVLATGKNYTHRIYLRDGIYADLTLTYQGGKFVRLIGHIRITARKEYLLF